MKSLTQVPALSDLDRHADLCVLGDRPHDHCICGMPMAPGADRCVLCDLEGLAPVIRRPPPDPATDGWDGRSYPSRRQHRLSAPISDGLIALLKAVFDPARQEADA